MSFSAFDHECMAEALRLAGRGLYTCDPNPRVGCVIARDGRVVGRGWHERAGGPHAEIVALRDAAGAARGGTAYVTLEPCAHHGRTPPCTGALVDAGIGRVVYAGDDPYPEDSGGGAQQLRAAGIQVESGLLLREAEALNPGFLTRARSGRPWMRVKTAISLDGRTALKNGDSQWISSGHSRRDVQRWRARSSAVLTGIGTVLADDPTLNARLEETVLQPLRVVVDSAWRTPPDARLFSEPGPVLVAGLEAEALPAGLERRAECLPLPGGEAGVDLVALLAALADRGMNEVQVEAGARLCGSLLRQDLVDELLVYQAPVLLGDGGPGPFAFGPLDSMGERTHLEWVESRRFGVDQRIRYTRHGH